MPMEEERAVAPTMAAGASESAAMRRPITMVGITIIMDTAGMVHMVSIWI